MPPCHGQPGTAVCVHSDRGHDRFAEKLPELWRLGDLARPPGVLLRAPPLCVFTVLAALCFLAPTDPPLSSCRRLLANLPIPPPPLRLAPPPFVPLPVARVRDRQRQLFLCRDARLGDCDGWVGHRGDQGQREEGVGRAAGRGRAAGMAGGEVEAGAAVVPSGNLFVLLVPLCDHLSGCSMCQVGSAKCTFSRVISGRR